jgi:hypothetical protein
VVRQRIMLLTVYAKDYGGQDAHNDRERQRKRKRERERERR